MTRTLGKGEDSPVARSYDSHFNEDFACFACDDSTGYEGCDDESYLGFDNFAVTCSFLVFDVNAGVMFHFPKGPYRNVEMHVLSN